jgi:DNA-binding SARP family transcriptional activator
MEFRILGPLEVVEDGRPVAVQGTRERALLAYLLLHANQAVAVERLIDDLWGESAPSSARKSLQVRVARLRKALGGGDRIVTRAPGYMLQIGPDELDLTRFEQLAARAAEAEPAAAAELLRSALDLWRGSPLADFSYESFAQAAIQRLEEIRLVAVERKIDADLTLGRQADLVPELRELVREHPLRERFRGQLMLALYRSDRQGEALDAYRDARSSLVEVLGIEPGAALRELEHAILVQDPALVDTTAKGGDRSILVLVNDPRRLDHLAELARGLAAQLQREVIVVRAVPSPEELAAASTTLAERREDLVAKGIAARSAVFTSEEPAEDVLRLTAEQDVALLLVDAPRRMLEDDVLAELLGRAPCDVGVLVARERADGPVLVPFAGAEHDWAAIEIAAWAAKATEVVIRLAGPTVDPTGQGRDASRMLASASLAVQRALGVRIEPVLVSPGPDELVRSAEDAGLVVFGLSDRWRDHGLGDAREALARGSSAPVLIVRRGLRPGGLAPLASITRFTWTIMPTAG